MPSGRASSALMGIATAIALSGWALAHYLYKIRPAAAHELADRTPRMYRTLLNKYYVDEFYDAGVVEPLKRLGAVWDWFDQRVIDGVVRAVGRLTETSAAFSTLFETYIIYGSINIIGYSNHLAARVLRRLQTGMVHHYAAIIVAGLFLLVHLLWVWWTGSSSVGLAAR